MQSTVCLIVYSLRYVDARVIAVVIAAVWKWQTLANPLETLILASLVAVCASLLKYYGLDESHLVEDVAQLVRSLFSERIVGLGWMLQAALAAGVMDSVKEVTKIFVVSPACLLRYRLLVYGVLRWARTRGFDQRQVSVVGHRLDPGLLHSTFSGDASWGVRRAFWLHARGEGRVRPDTPLEVDEFVNRTTSETSLVDLLRDNPVDEALVWTDPERLQDYRPILDACREHGLFARVVLRDSQFLLDAPPTAAAESFGGEVALSADGGVHLCPGPVVKRLIDILASIGLIVFLSPLLCVVALLVKLAFPQPRMGRNGRVFGIRKFRTMVDAAEVRLPALAARNITEGLTFKSRNDWRGTRVGRWLRRFSHNELPQLFNVLCRTMSLVGPCLLPVREAIQISGPYWRRFSVCPGITFGSWMSMDLESVDGWSLC